MDSHSTLTTPQASATHRREIESKISNTQLSLDPNLIIYLQNSNISKDRVVLPK
jgi:hypothetical protein